MKEVWDAIVDDAHGRLIGLFGEEMQFIPFMAAIFASTAGIVSGILLNHLLVGSHFLSLLTLALAVVCIYCFSSIHYCFQEWRRIFGILRHNDLRALVWACFPPFPFGFALAAIILSRLVESGAALDRVSAALAGTVVALLSGWFGVRISHRILH